MSKYNKGDKFEIEIADILTDCADGKTRYLIKGFSSLIFDDYGLDRLKQTKPEEPEIDWSKVPMDTTVLVKHDLGDPIWEKRYFAYYNEDYKRFYTWTGGATSWTTDGNTDEWRYAKIVEVEQCL